VEKVIRRVWLLLTHGRLCFILSYYERGGISQMMQIKTYQPGETIISEGEKSRDLFVLTEGKVEILKEDENGNIVLNEIEPPQIFGEISFLMKGEPRTATAKAKTLAHMFVLRYDDVKEQIAELPEWLKPVLNALIGRIKSGDKRIKELEHEILRLKGI
jgi:CRP-like cAMP-binding protein